MARAGPRKVACYGERFKATAVKLVAYLSLEKGFRR